MSVSVKQDLKKDESLIQGERSDSPEPSCVSMKSDWSMHQPINFRNTDCATDLRLQKNKSKLTEKSHLEAIFKDLEHKVITLIKNELKRFKKLLSPDYPACSEREVEDEEDQSSVREGALKITLHFLKNMNLTDLANTLQNKLVSVYQQKLKFKLREKCKRINEGISQHGSSTLLNEIYTDLYITEGGSGDVNNEHEVRQIETASRRPATQETPIKYGRFSLLVCSLALALDCHRFTRPVLRLCAMLQEMRAAPSRVGWTPSRPNRPALPSKIVQLSIKPTLFSEDNLDIQQFSDHNLL
ncbi:hypothetical protein PDJAM_G00011960 [Pangasius djambal]|uniref:Uncharacterized protein n=1 Tax=Pangasius djambal TaxID=1691987 RepID=A0ACC5Y0J4_9TELE|nr:hypothetical protein [Pangasius djambal]